MSSVECSLLVKDAPAEALKHEVSSYNGRDLRRDPIALLDGNVTRKHLSSELSFPREHRDLNIKYIVYFAREIAKQDGISICPKTASYKASGRKAAAGINRLPASDMDVILREFLVSYRDWEVTC